MPEETLTGRERVLNALPDQETGRVPNDLGDSWNSAVTVLDDLIEIDVDAINPVQTTANDMEPERLKPIHNVQPDVPVDKLLAMINAVLECGWFPLRGS